MNRIRFALVALMVICLSLAGCGTKTASDNMLLVGNGAEPQGIDPHVVTGVTEHRILYSLFEGLVRLDPETLEPIPGVAESWEMSEDGLTYTFHLREDAKWSNGEPVVAGHFAYAWQRILTPELGSPYAYMLHCIRNARAFNEGELEDFSEVGVEAVDDRTLQVHLNVPTPWLLQMQIHYTWFPVHPANIEEFGGMAERGTRWTRPGNLVSNGPFVLSDWQPDAKLVVTKNPEYWNADSVRLDGVVFRPLDNFETEEKLFRDGQLHMTSTLTPEKFDVYQEENPAVLRNDPYLGSYYYRVNVTAPPFDNVLVRQAFAYAVNREDLVDNVVRMGRTPAYFYTPPGTAGYTCEHPQAYDPEKARALLAEAGYPDGEGFPGGEILYNTSEQHKQVAQALQAMWKKELNVEVDLLNQEWKVYLNSMDQLDYDGLARSGWIADYEDPLNFLECLKTGNGNNRTGWSNAEYDALLEKAEVTVDQAERHALYQQAEAILMDEAPLIPLYFYTQPRLLSTDVRNFHGNRLGYIPFDTLWLESAETADAS
jgi:oligopeptide transport system substrate-binding protein